MTVSLDSKWTVFDRSLGVTEILGRTDAQCDIKVGATEQSWC